MSNIEVSWHDEARNVLRQDFMEGWTWDELIDVMRETFGLMEQADKPGILVVDLTRPKVSQSTQTSAFARYQTIRAMIPPNLALIVPVGVNSVMKALAEIYTRAVNRKKVRVEFVDTMADVDRVIEDFFASLA